MLSKTAKSEIVKEFSEKFTANPSIFVVDYKGLNVKEMESVRKRLKSARAELKVAKNNLIKIASKDTDVDKINDLFQGPTALAICDDDPVSVAKVFVEYSKDVESFEIKGGIVEGKVRLHRSEGECNY